MELRVLNYFLAVTREMNISKAALSLHLSQPTLSRQLKELENELGKQLFIRSNSTITLTEEGEILKKRASEILELAKRTEDEVMSYQHAMKGHIYIGAGETDSMRILAKAAYKMKCDYPDIHYHISSGDFINVLQDMDHGLLDFGIVFNDVNPTLYDSIDIPIYDQLGVLIYKEHPLSHFSSLTLQQLCHESLIIPRYSVNEGETIKYIRKHYSIAATYNLIYNASIMVEEKLGIAVCFDKLIKISKDGSLKFIPLEPAIQINMKLVWKKNKPLSKQAHQYLQYLQAEIKNIEKDK